MGKFEELYESIINENKDIWNIEGIAKEVMADMKADKADVLDVDDYLFDIKNGMKGHDTEKVIKDVISDVKEYIEKHYE